MSNQKYAQKQCNQKLYSNPSDLSWQFLFCFFIYFNTGVFLKILNLDLTPPKLAMSPFNTVPFKRHIHTKTLHVTLAGEQNFIILFFRLSLNNGSRSTPKGTVLVLIQLYSTAYNIAFDIHVCIRAINTQHTCVFENDYGYCTYVKCDEVDAHLLQNLRKLNVWVYRFLDFSSGQLQADFYRIRVNIRTKYVANFNMNCVNNCYVINKYDLTQHT